MFKLRFSHWVLHPNDVFAWLRNFFSIEQITIACIVQFSGLLLFYLILHLIATSGVSAVHLVVLITGVATVNIKRVLSFNPFVFSFYRYLTLQFLQLVCVSDLCGIFSCVFRWNLDRKNTLLDVKKFLMSFYEVDFGVIQQAERNRGLEHFCSLDGYWLSGNVCSFLVVVGRRMLSWELGFEFGVLPLYVLVYLLYHFYNFRIAYGIARAQVVGALQSWLHRGNMLT